jgi:hypothetical protein
LFTINITQRGFPRTACEYLFGFRIIKYVTYRGITTVLGFCLLLIWVDQLNYSDRWGNLAVSLPGIVIGFIFAAFLVWDDSEISKRQSGTMYFVSDACFIVVSQIAYFGLVSSNLTWWQAKGSLIVTLGPLSYLINHWIIFHMRERDSEDGRKKGAAACVDS